MESNGKVLTTERLLPPFTGLSSPVPLPHPLPRSSHASERLPVDWTLQSRVQRSPPGVRTDQPGELVTPERQNATGSLVECLAISGET